MDLVLGNEPCGGIIASGALLRKFFASPRSFLAECYPFGMISQHLYFLTLSATLPLLGLIELCVACWVAPEGFEDQDGFHYCSIPSA